MLEMLEIYTSLYANESSHSLLIKVMMTACFLMFLYRIEMVAYTTRVMFPENAIQKYYLCFQQN